MPPAGDLLNGVFAVAQAHIDQSKLAAISILRDGHHVLVILRPGFQLLRAVSGVVVITGDWVIARAVLVIIES